MKNTPGPWSVENAPTSCPSSEYTITHSFEIVADIPAKGIVLGSNPNELREAQMERAKANANLIAAAPEMRKVLEKVGSVIKPSRLEASLDYAMDGTKISLEMLEVIGELYPLIEVAIKLADGELDFCERKYGVGKKLSEACTD